MILLLVGCGEEFQERIKMLHRLNPRNGGQNTGAVFAIMDDGLL